MNYEPAPNSGADRVLTFLKRMDADAPGCETISSIVSKEARVPADQLAVTMAPAIQAGACFVRQKGGAHNSPRFWSLVDRNAPVTKTGAASVFEWRGPAQRPEGSGIRVVKAGLRGPAATAGEDHDDVCDDRAGRDAGESDPGADGTGEGGDRVVLDGGAQRQAGVRPSAGVRVAHRGNAGDALISGGELGRRKPTHSSTGEASSPAYGSQTPDGEAMDRPAKAGSDEETHALRAAVPTVRPTDGPSDDAQRTQAGASTALESNSPGHLTASSPSPDASNRHEHPEPGSQHVVKAEAARPDATDRDAPDNASPVGGPMGAGQAAAAAPRAKFALWSTGELSITFRDSPTITLDVASTSALCHYLDRLREAS